MTRQDTTIHVLVIIDLAELTAVDGGYIWDSSCPSYPKDDDSLFAPFGPPIGPIVLC